MKTSNKSTGAMSFRPTLVRFRIGLAALLGGLLLAFVLMILNALAGREAFASVAHSLPGEGSAQVMLSVDPACGTLDGITIDHIEEVVDWYVMMGNGAISATLTTVTGCTDQAVQLSYNLGVTSGAWVQLRRDFNPPLDLSAGDHLRFFHRGTMTNTLEIGLVSTADQNYFGSSWNEATHVPWCTYATWDLRLS